MKMPSSVAFVKIFQGNNFFKSLEERASTEKYFNLLDNGSEGNVAVCTKLMAK